MNEVEALFAKLESAISVVSEDAKKDALLALDELHKRLWLADIRKAIDELGTESKVEALKAWHELRSLL